MRPAIFALSLCACVAGNKKAPAATGPDKVVAGRTPHGTQRPLLVGHSSDGQMVMAATHADAMRGLALMAGDLEVSGADPERDMICKREVPTGSHIPLWICRFKSEAERDAEDTRRMLQIRNAICMSRDCNQH